jgi:hypothetical protein
MLLELTLKCAPLHAVAMSEEVLRELCPPAVINDIVANDVSHRIPCYGRQAKGV